MSSIINDEYIIEIDRLWKRYGLPLDAQLANLWTGITTMPPKWSFEVTEKDGPWSLKNVSFKLKRGDSLGIVGRNGAGKSTLLKVIAGVTTPTFGRVTVRGRVFSMIELNAGIHRDLTGRENVRLIAAVMGMSPEEIDNKMEDIESFCELGRFFDRPLRTFSTGMQARLGFGTALCTDCEILMIDEILSVGDAAFNKKSMAAIQSRLEDESLTTILVSHNTRQIERLCNKAILLQQGDMISSGQSRDIVNEYIDMINRVSASKKKKIPDFVGSQEIVMESLTIENVGEKPGDVIIKGQPVFIRLKVKVKETVVNPIIALGIRSDAGDPIIGWNNEVFSARGTFEPGIYEYVCRAESLPLIPGKYYFSLKIVGADAHVIYGVQPRIRLAEFQLRPENEKEHWQHLQGVVDANIKWLPVEPIEADITDPIILGQEPDMMEPGLEPDMADSDKK